MTGVTGIGGFFFRARDKDALAAWYRQHLGIAEFWQQAAGPTVFAPFRQETDYFPAEKGWMLNLRVADLDVTVAALQASGIAVERRVEWDTAETGRFARIHDPEGNPIELWEVPASSEDA